MQVSNAQHQAITHGAGPAIVLAGPGSGKTLVITQRVRYLIEAYHVRPQEILVITFTKAAAQEMQSRFQALSRQRGVTFGTFHAVFFHILKYAYHYSAANILTEEKKYQILQRLLSESGLHFEDEIGLVGSSNNPVSGMTIATLLLVTAWLKATNTIGMPGMIAAISIASVICIVAALAGDTSQDLKTGFLLGATPRRQQIGELIGVVVSAVTIGGVMMLLNHAWQFGSEALAAPQATLMKMITEGVMEGNLPWTLIFIGVFIGVAVEFMGVPVLPVAIGLYLPFELSASILVGGILRYVSSGKKKDDEGGILFCSGLIAGEGLMGIVLALLAVFGKSDKIDLSHWMDTGIFGAAALVFVIAACILISAREKKKPAD